MVEIKYTLLGTNISPEKSILKMIFLFPRWDMLISWRVSDLIPNVESTIGDLSFWMIQILVASCGQLEQCGVFRKIPPHSVKLKERHQSNNGAETHMVLKLLAKKHFLEVMEPTKEEWLNPVGRVSGSSTELEE